MCIHHFTKKQAKKSDAFNANHQHGTFFRILSNVKARLLGAEKPVQPIRAQ